MYTQQTQPQTIEKLQVRKGITYTNHTRYAENLKLA